MKYLGSFASDKDVATKDKIPTAISDLTNDSNFITSDDLVPGSTMTFVSYQTDEVATWENDTSIFPTGSGTSLPDQTGHSGQFLTTNGTTPSWGTVPVPSGSSTSPKMDGTATVGTETTWAHGDHVHPSDTNKQNKITANGILKGNGSGTISAAVAGTDYQSPLTAGTDYQTPLVAGTDYQTPLPSQSGNSGKFLTTNGSAMSWGSIPSDSNKQDKITASGILKGDGSGGVSAAVSGTDYQTPLTAGTDYQTPLPSQSGNSGKFLTTDGTDLSWGTPSGGGGGDSNIFVATYGTTTTADIEAAYQAGKLIYCIYSSRLYTYGYRSSATAHYFYAWQGNTKYYIYTSSTATWSNSSTSMAPTASPGLTGNPTAPTQTAGNDSTRLATTAFVTTAINNAIAAALEGGY